MKKTLKTAFVSACALAVLLIFSGCSSDKNEQTSSNKNTDSVAEAAATGHADDLAKRNPEDYENATIEGGKKAAEDGAKETPSAKDFKNPIDSATSGNKRITPDLNSVNLAAPSTSETKITSDDNFLSAFVKFVNPNGNKYDAISILGKFRYQDTPDADIMTRMDNASKEWHKVIEQSVGEKCVVTMTLEKKTSYDMSDQKVKDWTTANNKTPEAFTAIECFVRSNYSSGGRSFSFDIVKIDGAWYLAEIGTLGNVQSLITNTIFK
ncbi:MAG: hypothetical protein SOW78_09530 [Clostridia bacterium]|nr:hypothetical protein [Clostridia bacterium]